MKMITALVRMSIRLSQAFDSAAYSVCCEEEAAAHYKYEVTTTRALRCWLSGFIEGFQKEAFASPLVKTKSTAGVEVLAPQFSNEGT